MSLHDKVQDIYGAFGRGDVPAILAHLAPDVQWEYGMVSTDVPWLKPRRGHAEVAGFFQESGAATTYQHFQTKAILEGDHLVVALIDAAYVVNATGKTVVEEDAVNIWHFDNAGLVTKFRHRVDTHQQWLAWRP
jgi:ketosteroid isomerase-like protein